MKANLIGWLVFGVYHHFQQYFSYIMGPVLLEQVQKIIFQVL
jgi:hypothetical protein